MKECLRDINDNIYFTGNTRKEHKENLEKVCTRLQKCGLKANFSKFKFMVNKVKVLGYVIDKNGLHLAFSKMQAMENAPAPRNMKKLESFLGLINFYAQFLEDRASKLKPLYDQLSNKEFVLNSRCQNAYKWVKAE